MELVAKYPYYYYTAKSTNKVIILRHYIVLRSND